MRFPYYLLAFLLLAGCVGTPVLPPAADPQLAWQQHREQLAGLDRWSIDGRIAIQTGNEGWHASLEWQQRGDGYTIALSGPFGQGAVRLEGDGDRVTLRTGEDEALVDDDPELLLYRQLGWRVPVNALRYWVLGIPAPGPEVHELNAQGFLARLQQAGWNIEFRDYARQGDRALPGKVFVSNHQARVRLVIDQWTLGAPS